MSTRRIVTGIDSAGKSYVVHDGPAPASVDIGRVVLDDVWVDVPGQPDPEAKIDPVAGDVQRLVAPGDGSVVRVVWFYPEGSREEPDAATIEANLARWDAGGAMEEGESGEEGWHTTATIDYGIVITGEIDLGLDSGDVRVSQGDVVVQRATRHAWKPVGDEPCAIAFVLISSSNYR